MQSTFQAKSSTIQRRWHLIDAQDQVLGRLASKIARHLSGKDKRVYTPHVDCGDFVVVINAQGIRITGNNKPVQKIDFRHSGYPGGDTITPYGEFLKKRPERAILLAVSGMLPKTKLRGKQIAKLRVYKGDTHPHKAQFYVKPTVAEPTTPEAQS